MKQYASQSKETFLTLKQKVSLLIKIYLLCTMTLNEAFIQLVESDKFKEIAKQKNIAGGKSRSYLSRFKAGKLKSGAIVELLIANGYEVKADKVKKLDEACENPV